MNKKFIPFIPFLIVFYSLTALSCTNNEKNSVRSYPLSGHGQINFSVPKAWRETVRYPPGGLPPTIVFTPESDSSFQVLISTFFPFAENITLPKPEDLLFLVSQAAEKVKSQVIEKDIPIEEFRGDFNKGYYFRVTDKALKKGEYKYMTQGHLLFKTISIIFTIFTNEGAEDIQIEAMKMLKTAVHVEKQPS